MMNREQLLCGCEMLWSDSGLVVSVDTCAFCAPLGLINVQAARLLQDGVREGREASEAGDTSVPSVESL